MTSGKMHSDEIRTDVALVRRLLAGQFPEWAALPLQPIPSAGTDNALYRLGDEMVVRLPRTQRTAALVGKEVEWLPRLTPLLPVDVPLPLAKGMPAEGYPWAWSVNRWLEGENPILGHTSDPDSLARDLAGFVHALQRIDPTGGPRAGEQNFFRGVPLAMRNEPTRTAMAELQGTIDTEAVTSAWEAALRTPETTSPPVWIHGDLAPGNLLLQGDRLTGVIDFGCLGVGDPAAELIVAWNLIPAHARTLFRTELDVDDATWDRGRGWALSVALIQLPYYRDTNPPLAANSCHVIREVLADHLASR
jgi:aminoglycoside phosphotransferase (APT) family kinase protein